VCLFAITPFGRDERKQVDRYLIATLLIHGGLRDLEDARRELLAFVDVALPQREK
jgi:hypothetical protein